MERNKELIDSLLRFQELLDTQPDHPDSIPVFTAHIRSFLKIKPIGRTLPTIEMMTLFKKRKPQLFYMLKRYTKDDVLIMLTCLNMDYDQALSRIDRILMGEVIA
ncbi:hypothetical protein [Fictibacillus barbaricus]|uniref:Uncharacterized protein n=1 Tax=Fictibacillus barbaricus TaxID=182136 RepID=A0ABU1U3A4_9BACL|nr:hypothetical protein [Fictibacillus barbaricus]MDR7073938.1 hypothetical protein [Fictibacillus barbaricus]